MINENGQYNKCLNLWEKENAIKQKKKIDICFEYLNELNIILNIVTWNYFHLSTTLIPITSLRPKVHILC